ncbi:MAG: N(G),N(G)-dimethylarginine dimethylaminohydrolase [bacterium]|nr:MAG: N(G),N(G)-dimethylarginine dimethylaminohydrolase [bacterium]
MYTKAIVRTPCKKIINGLTTANLGRPDYEIALKQHSLYIEALKECGLEVIILEPDENFPDSTFVEDAALLIPQCAIICNPGAPSRKGEIVEINQVLEEHFRNIENIKDPGTVDGGDIFKVGTHFYIGISARTNLAGAQQVISILNRHGMLASTVPLKNVLHLKSGVSYLEKNNLVVSGEFIENLEFQSYNLIKVDEDESYAANCVWINEKVLIAKGFPKTKNTIEKAGYETIKLDVSEFRKVDGGLSCLSLRF